MGISSSLSEEESAALPSFIAMRMRLRVFVPNRSAFEYIPDHFKTYIEVFNAFSRSLFSLALGLFDLFLGSWPLGALFLWADSYLELDGF